MSATSIEKRIKYIFLLTIFSGLCGLGLSILPSLSPSPHRFAEIPLFPLIVLAEGIVFWLAFKSDSREKALNQISTLKIFSLILAAYGAYSLVMYFVFAIISGYFSLFSIWSHIVSNLSAALASLAIFFTSITLTTGDTKKFVTASTVILVTEVVLVFSASLAALIYGDMLTTVITVILLFLFLFSFVPKILGNAVVKGAIVGSIIAGDVGAVVGAIAASKSGKK